MLGSTQAEESMWLSICGHHGFYGYPYTSYVNIHMQSSMNESPYMKIHMDIHNVNSVNMDIRKFQR